jgi:AhpD family alkylhydroperoxidase
MTARMTSPALKLPGVLDALQALSQAASAAANQAGLPQSTVELVNLRASQINGCAVCLDMLTRGAKTVGESDRSSGHVAGLAGRAVLQRGGTGRSGTRRGGNPDCR